MYARIAIHENGNLYVTQYGDYVRIIDLKTCKTIKTVGKGGSRIAYSGVMTAN